MSGKDKKWEELSNLLQDDTHMFDAEGNRRKLVIFTEHRDTLHYLRERISTLLGRPEAVVTIHGGMGRDERHRGGMIRKSLQQRPPRDEGAPVLSERQHQRVPARAPRGGAPRASSATPRGRAR